MTSHEQRERRRILRIEGVVKEKILVANQGRRLVRMETIQGKMQCGYIHAFQPLPRYRIRIRDCIGSRELI